MEREMSLRSFKNIVAEKCQTSISPFSTFFSEASFRFWDFTFGIMTRNELKVQNACLYHFDSKELSVLLPLFSEGKKKRFVFMTENSNVLAILGYFPTLPLLLSFGAHIQ